ncbi:putative 1-acylglycerophosphocholine O-acyltransferase 1 [Monocercomonoides exilis]|uniref:putative 1-acylglycerophosphocholine O-acyltransferase 1 n=1 Tax=Monocercomonoides exilis TaxID=2049356 RepID=UPI003559728F|nr:putative 1-acylglycerophosphocholine O-acyltransferase 1 [Monocercomonoides exilis]|eukprot:MONOS_8702.1-p1 / transcript=MONOS_8702.1 / gene=MONOS_8702 / organism=Monocercomonoides_exilis_PA203 / gene_product=JD1 / transcript_product=JD1 / location=Mono_scaffold00335:18691-20062(+) / protein_length=365 / sequence_SO=supercontig / SO=protein_coding / is_pseudo=false
MHPKVDEDLMKKMQMPPKSDFGIDKRSTRGVYVFLHYVCQRIVFIGYNDWEKPAPKWRRVASQYVMRFWCIVVMVCAGFFHIKYIDHTKKRPVSRQPKDLPKFKWNEPYPLVGPHMSLFDIISVGGYVGTPSFVAKATMKNVPIVSFLLKAYRCILVEREVEKAKTGNSHSSSAGLIVERISYPQPNEYTPHIFAEGTTGNGTCITRFSKGVFIAGVPVRPFAVHYPYKFSSINYDSVDAFPLMWNILTQFYCSFELEIFDVYNPSEAEKADPQLYTSNVGRYIADQVGLPYIDDIDMRDKTVCLHLQRGKITWNEALDELDHIDQLRKEEKIKDAERAKANMLALHRLETNDREKRIEHMDKKL